MIDQSIRDFVAALGARTPAPGGGAAGSVAGTMGAALALMVVRFARRRPHAPGFEDALDRAEALLDDHVGRLLPMAERDAAAFGRVAEAYKLPNDTDEQKAMRHRAIQEGMRGAMVVPEELLCMVRDVLAAASSVRGAATKAIVSDLVAGSGLLLAAAEGAFLNIRINASYLDDEVLAATTLDRARGVLDEIRTHDRAIRAEGDARLA